MGLIYLFVPPVSHHDAELGRLSDMTDVIIHQMEQGHFFPFTYSPYSIPQTSFSMHAKKIYWSYPLIKKFKMFLNCECFSSEQKLKTEVG